MNKGNLIYNTQRVWAPGDHNREKPYMQGCVISKRLSNSAVIRDPGSSCKSQFQEPEGARKRAALALICLGPSREATQQPNCLESQESVEEEKQLCLSHRHWQDPCQK